MASILGAIGGGASLAATAVGFATNLIGGLIQSQGILYQGQAEAAQAMQQARAMKKKGDDEFAIGQRKMLDRQKEKKLALSRQQAIAASSGGDASDPSVTAIMNKTEERGQYAAMLDMYNGVIARNDLYRSGRDTIRSGLNALEAAKMQASATIYSAFVG